MQRVLARFFGEQHKLKTALQGLLVLMRSADLAGFGALHLDHVVLGHTISS